MIRGFSPNADGRLDPGNGSYGRIGLPRAAFDKLGGYDENLLPMGCQDSDLLDRARAHGMRVVRVPQQVPFAIRNTDDEKVKYTGSSLSWHDMWQRNLRQAEENLRLGRLTVNHDRTPVKVLLNFTRQIEL
ncbi:galactosyltransferase-related protein [Streptomyces sp. NPDC021096]|uniref:galactosyltransferase-related protein n=1 Tax=Streptomyces sp. NPDC021096 TaxID=3154792 RepID=UPI0033F91DAE